MVGGKIIKVVQLPDSTWVNCEEHGYYYDKSGKRCASHYDQCAIRIERNTEVKVGDSLWWQGPWAMWTPKPDDGREDVRLKRLGYSHSTIPDDVISAMALPEGGKEK
jgi:hypothetical protein